jgi:subtilisin family serine protease
VSIPSHGRRARRRVIALLSAGAVVTGVLSGVPAATAAGDQGSTPANGKTARSYDAGRYIVSLTDAPAASYDGGVRGFPATRVAPGQQLRSGSSAVQKYTGRLRAEQVKVARSVGADVDRHLTVATNSFTTELTAKQATELAANKNVLALTEDTARQLDTWNTPSFLGLSGNKGVWKKETNGRKNAGAGVVVGVIDSGIWPESKSFKGKALTSTPQGKWRIQRRNGVTHMDKADGGFFAGACEAGEEWGAAQCNTKLIGARYYPAAYLANVPADERPETEYISPRDGDGHGSHTASTAAGQVVKNASVEDVDFGQVSGMAPAARVAAYKVCFDDGNPDTGDCYNSSIVSAIEDAVVDGVDVINMSISGSQTTVIDAVELAFEGAAEAGVFVAVSAGNNGPDPSTVAHNSPWLTTVAASTHTNFENTVVLGNGTKIKGASITQDALPQTPLVESADVVATGQDPAQAALCIPGTLDPAQVAGKIVLCDRGVNDRVEKSATVKAAGGVGMILGNVTEGSLDADFHSVPTVHIDHTQTPTVKSYIDTAGEAATAAFQLGDTTGGTPTVVPQIAGFSSRGPALANESDLLKPDVTAPGVSVLAAVAPPSGQDRSYDLYSGTSMASPHIAGLAALMVGDRPKWTPMQVKSAMMTTAKSLKNPNGKAIRDGFAQGAGHVTPADMFDPGLFVTSDADDWWGFIEAQYGADIDPSVDPIEAKDFNGPSMADSKVVNTTEFTREFKATRAGTWNISVDLPGFSSDVRKKIRMKKGEKKSVTLELTRTTAGFDTWAKGYLKLTGPSRVRLPIAVKPVALGAPAEVTGTGTDGSTEVPVTVGQTIDVTENGLAAAVTESGTAVNPKTDESDIVSFCVTVPADTKAARFNLDSADDGNGADMDLWVYEGCDTPGDWYNDYIALSATGSADESVTMENPPAGDYLVAVDPFTPADGKTSMDWTLDQFVLDPSDTAGDLTVTPNPLLPSTTEYVASWTGLDADTRYFGMFEYSGSPDRTYLTVDTTTAE